MPDLVRKKALFAFVLLSCSRRRLASRLTVFEIAGTRSNAALEPESVH
jgi:hypothetical protein